MAAAGLAFFSIWILRSIPQPEGNIPVYFLRSEEESTRSQARELTGLPHEAGNLVLVLQVSGNDPFSHYGVTIEAGKESSQKALWGFDNLRRDDRGEFTIRLPRSFLPPGQYRLRLFGLAGDQKTPLATYRIQINHPPGR